MRMSKNPVYYSASGSIIGGDLNDAVYGTCAKTIQILQDANMVGLGPLRCTDFGNAMARYGVKLGTMKSILDLPRQARISEIVRITILLVAKRVLKITAIGLSWSRRIPRSAIQKRREIAI